MNKIIHYCWFGGKKKPFVIRECVGSWEKKFPDFKIIEWNENNFEINNHFLKKCYDLKMWAFLSDYVRLKVLYDFGGIYLDTDMYVLKNFENLLKGSCVFAKEDDYFISAAIIWANPQNEFIKICLEEYNKKHLVESLNYFDITIPRIITSAYHRTQSEKQENIKIYSSEYFYPLRYSDRDDFRKFRNYLNENSFAIHLWYGSWIDSSEFYYISSREYFKAIKVISKMNFKDIFHWNYILKLFISIFNSIKKF